LGPRTYDAKGRKKEQTGYSISRNTVKQKVKKGGP